MCSQLFLPPPPCLKNAPSICITEKDTHTPTHRIFAFPNALQSPKVDIVILVTRISTLEIGIDLGGRGGWVI